MNSLIENFINGNLTTAKQQAKRYGFMSIIAALREDFAFSAEKAIATAAYLKGQGTFQEACDAI